MRLRPGTTGNIGKVVDYCPVPDLPADRTPARLSADACEELVESMREDIRTLAEVWHQLSAHSLYLDEEQLERIARTKLAIAKAIRLVDRLSDGVRDRRPATH